MTEIKKADTKGRINVGDDGQAYWVQRNQDGSILLNPLVLPDIPQMGNTDLRAIYVDPAQFGSHATTVTIFSSWGSAENLAEEIAGLADELMIPVVVDTAGIGAGVADMIADKTDQTVIRNMLGKKLVEDKT